MSWNRRRTSRTSLGVNIDFERRAIITGPSSSPRNAALEGCNVLVICRAAQGAARHDDGLGHPVSWSRFDARIAATTTARVTTVTPTRRAVRLAARSP